MASPVARLLLPVLLGCSTVIASAAHSKPRTIELLDVPFQNGASGTIETSLNPPIQGILRIVVRAKAFAAPALHGNSAGVQPSRTEIEAITAEVMQWDRNVPFRVVSPNGHRRLFRNRPSLWVAEIDVNDLTPGVPVRIRIHPGVADTTGLEGSAYVVY